MIRDGRLTALYSHHCGSASNSATRSERHRRDRESPQRQRGSGAATSNNSYPAEIKHAGQRQIHTRCCSCTGDVSQKIPGHIQRAQRIPFISRTYH
ncbi:hypothetical protein J6590_007477 [Homalodisca vitripennis]|nr:hypothetical protein J6590_007477 [Homalodisca vitripennis]